MQLSAYIPAGKTLDFDKILPADRSYITYEGSLTTPPCTGQPAGAAECQGFSGSGQQCHAGFVAVLRFDSKPKRLQKARCAVQLLVGCQPGLGKPTTLSYASMLPRQLHMLYATCRGHLVARADHPHDHHT